MTNEPLMCKGFKPVQAEYDSVALDVEGTWPRELNGTLYRIGPNPQFMPIPPYNPLMADGMVHAFSVSGGRVFYQNKWVRTRRWQLEHKAGRALFATSGDPRGHDDSVSGVATNGVANTHIVAHAGKLLALDEGHLPIELDPQTLSTKGSCSFNGSLTSNMTAHPKVDPLTGDLIYFANYPNMKFDGSIDWGVIDKSGVVTENHTIKAPYACLVHDFVVTTDFIVIPFCPLTLSIDRMMQGLPPIAWEPQKKTLLAIVKRSAPEDVRWFEGPSVFVWHFLNGWNIGDEIIVDLCQQNQPSFPGADGALPNPQGSKQKLTRWCIDWAKGPFYSTDNLSDTVCEYPRIDDRFATLPTRHGFVACSGGPGTDDMFHRAIGHFDGLSKQMLTYSFGDHCAVSEPVFIPRHKLAEEGDGFLICLVYNEQTDTSSVQLFEAQKVQRGPIALAQVSTRVPMGFHGSWIAS